MNIARVYHAFTPFSLPLRVTMTRVTITNANWKNRTIVAVS